MLPPGCCCACLIPWHQPFLERLASGSLPASCYRCTATEVTGATAWLLGRRVGCTPHGWADETKEGGLIALGDWRQERTVAWDRAGGAIGVGKARGVGSCCRSIGQSVGWSVRCVGLAVMSCETKGQQVLLLLLLLLAAAGPAEAGRAGAHAQQLPPERVSVPPGAHAAAALRLLLHHAGTQGGGALPTLPSLLGRRLLPVRRPVQPVQVDLYVALVGDRPAQ